MYCFTGAGINLLPEDLHDTLPVHQVTNSNMKSSRIVTPFYTDPLVLMMS